MKIIVIGATGMIGQGIVREAMRDTRVDAVLAVGRSPSGTHDPKLRDLVAVDLTDLSAFEGDLKGSDATLFALGASAAGLTEAEYTRITYDLTLSVGTTLAKLEPSMTFMYVSGHGTDASEEGRVMWARVKGRTENALLRLPFKAAYMFRPGVIVPLHGITSRTGWYRAIYAVMTPLFPLLKALFPRSITTTEQLAQAMISVAARGYNSPILEPRDITTF